MTPTQEELVNSSKFWKMRMEQQADYLRDFHLIKHTRPDKKEVIDSALMILERCQFYFLSAYILEEIGDFFEPAYVRRIFLEHVAIWNSTAVHMKVIAFPVNPKDDRNKGIIFTYT